MNDYNRSMPAIETAPSERRRAFGPTTRYQGSKRKLQNWLISNLECLPFTSVADIMSGGIAFAYAMKRLGKSVIANDYLTFNFRTAEALIENPSVHLTSEDISYLLASHRDVRYSSFIERTFRGMYFTDEENAWLDRISSNILAIQQRARNGQGGRFKAALAHHALVQACLAKRPFNLFHRKNLYLRQADVQRSFGNKTTWDTPFPSLFLRFADEANQCVFDNGRPNRALNYDVARLPSLKSDLVYIDPPYFAAGRERVRSDYRMLYHFVEGLTQYSRWPYLIDDTHNLKALLPETFSSQALFSCPVTDVEENYLRWLDGILAMWPNSSIALSYKHPGVPSIGSLRRLLVSTGRTVQIHAYKYAYALSRKNGHPRENIEVLLIGS